MKKLAIIFCLVTGMLTKTSSIAQDTEVEKNDNVIYAVAVNIVPDGFNAPLIGFVNIAKGNHNGIQLGFVNLNHGNFQGAQFSYFNTVGKATRGVQAGFINTTSFTLSGLQYGFINTVGNSTKGSQLGFINTTAKNAKGIQGGFVNTTADTIEGAQFGFVNTAGKKINGGQFGFINMANKLEGLQVGFINLVDSLEYGVPIGFISIVKHGGYQALELSANEIYPFNLALKLGVKKLYTTINFSYNPEWDQGFASGAGIGSILPIGEKLFFNPELISMNNIGKNFQKTSSLVVGFGYNITPRFHIMAGPSLSWHYATDIDVTNKPFLPLYEHQAYKNHELIIGARLGLRYSFQPL